MEASAPLPLAEEKVQNQQSSSLAVQRAYQRVKVDLMLSGFILFYKAALPLRHVSFLSNVYYSFSLFFSVLVF